MPTWPSAVDTTGMDADTDTLPRPAILDLTTKFNDLIAMRGVAGGVCDLDGDTLVPVARIPTSIARLASPAFTSNPTAPTQALRNNSTRLATTAFVAANSILNGAVAKAVGYTVLPADFGKLFECSVTMTLAVSAVATLGAGFVFAAYNSGTGTLTIDPDGSEPINTGTTLALGPGESCLVMVNADATGLTALFLGGSGGGAVGQVAGFAMSTAPTGWLKANGAAISRTTYAALFGKIGTTFGTGDGSTTFNLPDLRGEFMRGWDDGRGVDSGRVFGSAQAGDVESAALKLQAYGAQAGTAGVDTTGGPYPSLAYTDPNATPGSSWHDLAVASMRIASTGTGTETRPRNVALLACIKY